MTKQKAKLTIQQKSDLYHTKYTTVVSKPFSVKYRAEQKLPEHVTRLESHSWCLLCKTQMKTEWLPLHLHQSHHVEDVPVSYDEYIHAFVDDTGVMDEPVPTPEVVEQNKQSLLHKRALALRNSKPVDRSTTLLS